MYGNVYSLQSSSLLLKQKNILKQALEDLWKWRSQEATVRVEVLEKNIQRCKEQAGA